MLRTRFRDRHSRRPPRRIILEFGAVERLEARRLMSVVYPSPVNGTPNGSLGLDFNDTKNIKVDNPANSSTANGRKADLYVHNFTFFLNNSASSTQGLIGSSRVATITGNIIGPTGITVFDFHDKEVDLYVNGVNTVQLTGSTGITQVLPPTGNRLTATFTTSVTLPGAANAETMDSVSFVLKDFAKDTLGTSNPVLKYATPQISIFTITVDTKSPGVSPIAQVPTPGTIPIESIPVSLTDNIDPSTFDFNDLTLTRNGTKVPLGKPPVTVTPVGSSTSSFVIGGLTAATTPVGNYTLTVDATNISDTAGNSGSGSASVSFVVGSVPTLSSITDTTFIAGTSNTLPVSYTGFPTTGLTTTGTLPGVSLQDNGDGTGTSAAPRGRQWRGLQEHHLAGVQRPGEVGNSDLRTYRERSTHAE